MLTELYSEGREGKGRKGKEREGKKRKERERERIYFICDCY